MIEKLLCKIFHYRDIKVHGELYMRRIFLTPVHWKYRIVLHHIFLSDTDGEHDHPFFFWTLILLGSYLEKFYKNCDGSNQFGKQAYYRFNSIGTIRRNKAVHTHKVTVVKKPLWTLVFMGPAERKWGYHTSEGWIYWKDFTKKNRAEDYAEEDNRFRIGE